MHLCTFAISGENAYKITHTGVPKNGASLLSAYCLVQVSVAFLSKTLRQDLRLQGFPYLTRHWTPSAEHTGSASCGALPKNTSLLLRGSRQNGVLPGFESYPQHTLVKLQIPKHTLRRNGAERPRREANHSLMLIMSEAILPLPHTSSWRVCGQLQLTSVMDCLYNLSVQTDLLSASPEG